MPVLLSYDFCVVIVFQKLKGSKERLFREDAIIRNLIDVINICVSFS